MMTVAGSVDILLQGALKAEDAVELVPIDFAAGCLGELSGAVCPVGIDDDRVEMDALGAHVPGFGEEMQLMVRVAKGDKQALEVEFGTAGCGELSPDQSQLHP